MGKGRGTIEGLDPESPRTLEACLHRGITIEELQPREEKTFRRGMESAEFTHRRFDFFEKRRQDIITAKEDLERAKALYMGAARAYRAVYGVDHDETRDAEQCAEGCC